MRYIRYLAAATLIGAAAGCNDLALDVPNPNNPDRPRVLASPADVEGLASAQFQQIILATLGDIARVAPAMQTASFMNASTLANNGMGPRSLIPRVAINNSPGNPESFENYADFRILAAVARNSADVLARAKDPEFVLGSSGEMARLQAWAHFVSGVSHGYLSLTYDAAGIARFTDGPADIPELSDYREVNEFALEQFDSALVYLGQPGVPALPSGWLTGAGGPEVSAAEFRRVIHSFAARMRAGVARDGEERAAVDWTRVIADANDGIQSDFHVRLSPADGWDYNWMNTVYHFFTANWHQMTYYIIGMADVSGAYDQWLAQHRDQREHFTIITPDLRFPRGATRAEQTRPSADDDSPPPAGEYFRNRNPGKDVATTGWRASQYDHYRFRALADAGRIGDLPFFTRAENDMLAAEGYIRTGDIAAAAALIDRTRTGAGLPALSGVVTARDQPVPGGAQCVPRIPVAPTFTTTACGDILEAMKWEKRMETAYTTYGAWFFDHRGWDDLAIGTAVHWPVPWQEANARAIPLYNLGGVGNPGAAARNTYGFGDPNTGR